MAARTTMTRREAAAGCALALACAAGGGEAFAASTGTPVRPPAGFRTIARTFPVKLHGPRKPATPVTKTVLVSENDGPAVIVMHEVFGLTDDIVTFCRRLTAAGFRVYAPILFGEMGGGGSNAGLVGACIRGEISLLASGRSSRIVDWLRPLAVEAASDCEAWGKGAGVIGLCITGDFALAMAVEPKVLAPVMGEPSLPLRPVGDRRDLHVCDETLAKVVERQAGEGLVVRGYRFAGDRISYVEKFDELKRRLGPAFARGVSGEDIPDSEGRLARGRRNHAVFTLNYNEASPVMRGVMADLTGFLHARLDLASASIG